MVNPAWGTDCRCNHTLSWEQCCLPAPAYRKVKRMTSVKDAAVEAQCAHPFSVSQLLHDAVSLPEAENVDIGAEMRQTYEDSEAFLLTCDTELTGMKT